MIDAAKAGDVEAMEQLTLEDMDTYTLVSNRSKKEDIFTIVNSYFMPSRWNAINILSGRYHRRLRHEKCHDRRGVLLHFPGM